MIASHRSTIRALAGLGLAALWSTCLSAPAHAVTLDEADVLYKTEDWRDIERAYKRLVRREKTNGLVWFRLATAYHNLGKYDKAIKAYEEANLLGFNLANTRYNMACAYIALEDEDAAFQWLRESVDAGFADLVVLNTDVDLDPIRGGRFSDFMKETQRKLRPCLYDARYKAFDFLVGEWEVYDPKDKERQIGASNVLRLHEGCVLFEEWSTKLGATGVSMSHFDAGEARWVQDWVNNAGISYRMVGSLDENSDMHLTGERHDADGESVYVLGTWSQEGFGKIRHTLEVSNDGSTWTVEFDGIYVRKGRTP